MGTLATRLSKAWLTRRLGLVSAVVLAVFVGRSEAAGPYSPRRYQAGVDEWPTADTPAVDTTGHHVSRALAAALTVTLGPFGAHRIYFGAPPKVPLLYGLTFGGFGVLVLIDLGHVLFTKDLGKYQDNERVLMWSRPRGADPTPP